MPHFTIEYSANLDGRVDMGAVVELVRKEAVATGIFPLGGIRVRAVKCEHYAIANGAEAKRDWIAAMVVAGRSVPAPTAEATEGYSGKWVLRTPKSLHRGLAERARQEGVSLNALAVAMLAQGLGQRMPREGG